MSSRDDTIHLAELLRETGRGNRRAFAELYRLTAPRLFALARRMLRRPELAEEVLQDAFAAIWRFAGEYQPERAAATTWMFNIVRNRCLDLLRRPDIETLAADHESLPEPESEDPDGCAALVSRREEAAVRAAFAALPVRERLMIGMAYYRGLSHSEIATELDEPLGTVKTIVRRALMKLRRHVAPQGDEGAPPSVAPRASVSGRRALVLAMPSLPALQ